MLTFSQIVDSVANETKRFDMLGEYASYLNQAIREVHFENEWGNVVFFQDNYHEELITATNDQIESWTMPRPELFQGGIVARFNGVIDERGHPRYALGLTPGPRLEQEPYAFYRAGRQVHFKGFGGVGRQIALSWFEYPPALKYYAVDQRPASYDIESGWTYLPEYDVDDASRATAERLVSNWLTLRWHTVLEEALRAKSYKRAGDENRQRTSYSLYMQLRRGLFTSEIAHSGGMN